LLSRALSTSGGLLYGGCKNTLHLALLPLRLVPGLSRSSAPAEVEAESLSRAALELNGRRDRAAAVRRETAMLWRYTNAVEKQRVVDFFDVLGDRRWQLDSVSNGVEVWRLPGRGKLHTIMGVAEVDAAPATALSLFRDPARVCAIPLYLARPPDPFPGSRRSFRVSTQCS
jgi:hypothetical protein